MEEGLQDPEDSPESAAARVAWVQAAERELMRRECYASAMQRLCGFATEHRYLWKNCHVGPRIIPLALRPSLPNVTKSLLEMILDKLDSPFYAEMGRRPAPEKRKLWEASRSGPLPAPMDQHGQACVVPPAKLTRA
jgi:hypothetical protein